jgi:hypothetical protein
VTVPAILIMTSMTARRRGRGRRKDKSAYQASSINLKPPRVYLRVWEGIEEDLGFPN